MSSLSFKGLFGGGKKSASNNDRHQMTAHEIGMPTNVVHDIHVGKNAFGELEGKTQVFILIIIVI